MVKDLPEIARGIPSRDTLRQAQGNAFSRLNPEQFQDCFTARTQAMAQLLLGEVAAIDGQTVRRSHDRAPGKKTIHLVSAWTPANTMTLGQVKANEKTNEITAIPQLPQMLELQGCTIGIDAMGCQKDIARGILDGGADCVPALKENQGRLYEDVRDLFEGAEEFGFAGARRHYAAILNEGRGRPERRERWVISGLDCLECLSNGPEWPSLRPVARLAGRRETGSGVTEQPGCWRQSAATGASGIRCTGAWMRPLAKTNAGCARTMARKTWRHCARYPTAC